RTTNEIFREQTTLIRELLDSRIEQLHEIHPVLGWRYAANYRKGLNRLNAAGLRSDHEYQKTPPSGLLRIAAFGDSFVYGSEVDGKEAWPAVLEQNRRIEVLNYGVPGYGTDQAYLRYQGEGDEYRPQLVLLGFVSADLARAVNVYRRFLHNRDLPLF